MTASGAKQPLADLVSTNGSFAPNSGRSSAIATFRKAAVQARCSKHPLSNKLRSVEVATVLASLRDPPLEKSLILVEHRPFLAGAPHARLSDSGKGCR